MNDRVNYSYAYYVKGRNDIADEFAIEDNMMRNLAYAETITWDVVLRDFIDFLSGIYGYDIAKQVKFMTLQDKLDLLREEEDLSMDWPWDDEEESTNAEGEEAPKV